MITEIERQFFETFEIARICRNNLDPGQVCKGVGMHCDRCTFYEYPAITESRLLELLRLGLNESFVIYSKDLAELKEKGLYLLIRNKTPMLQGRIQAIFKENEQ